MSHTETIRKRLVDELPRIRACVRRVSGRTGEVDDITQECCARIIQKEKLWSGRSGTFLAWIRAVVRNVTFRHLSRDNSRRMREGERINDVAAPDRDIPDEKIRWILRQFAHLTPAQKEVLHLRYFEGLRTAEIAERLGINPQSVSNRISNAIETLQRRARGWTALPALVPLLFWHKIRPFFGGIFMGSKVKLVLAATVIFTIGMVGGTLLSSERDSRGPRTKRGPSHGADLNPIALSKENARLKSENARLQGTVKALAGEPTIDEPVDPLSHLPAEVRARLNGTLTWLKKLSEKEFGDWTVEDLARRRYVPLFCLLLKGEDLSRLSALPNLDSINLSGSTFTNKELAGIAALTRLRTAILYDTPINDEGLKLLGALRDLESISISNNRDLTDSGLAGLSKLPLKSLTLMGTDITDDGLTHLPGSLKQLNLNRSREITDQGLQTISELRSMSDLNLGATGISDVGAAYLASLEGLEKLNVNNTRVSDAGLKSLANLKSLRHLNVSATGISDEGLWQLASMSSLKTIVLKDNPQLSRQAIDAFRARRPDVGVID